MDIWNALEELYQERQRLDRAIIHLEALLKGQEPPPLSRRGRKNMPDDERKIVAERMRKYWEQRRNAKAQAS